MRRFEGLRPDPPAEYITKGISNGGITGNGQPDYEGVVWSDGTVTIRWCTAYRSTATFDNWDDFHHVHGHPEYGTVIRWLDPT